MKIRSLGQSGYLIKTKHTEIIIDPYLSDSVNRIANRPRMLPIPIDPATVSCDAVICTHNHLDHLDPDTVSRMKSDQFFITTHEGKAALEQLGKTNVCALSLGKSLTVGEITITAVFADHTVEAFGIILTAEGKTLYFSGDTLFHEDLFGIGDYKPDIAFICINGKLGNMNVEQAVTVAERIGASVNIPNHYDMFKSNSENPYRFTEKVKGGMVLGFNEEFLVL